MAAEKAAAEESKATLWSPLTLTIAVVTAVVVAYAFMSGAGEVVVGAAAGAAAAVCVLNSLWEKEERTGLAVAVTGVTGGIAGIAAAMLRSAIGERSLIGAAIVGAIAGAAIVAIAKQFIKNVIVALKVLAIVSLAAILKWITDKILWLKDKIKWAVSQVKTAAKWIIEAAKTAFNTLASWLKDKIKWAVSQVKTAAQWIIESAFNTLASFGATGLAVAAAGVIASIALASTGISGLAAGVAGLASGLFGGLLGLVLIFAAGAVTFGYVWREQSSQPQTQGEDVILPVAAFLLFVLFCFLVISVGVFRCCLLLFLFLFLWFLMCYRSERH